MNPVGIRFPGRRGRKAIAKSVSIPGRVSTTDPGPRIPVRVCSMSSSRHPLPEKRIDDAVARAFAGEDVVTHERVQ